MQIRLAARARRHHAACKTLNIDPWNPDIVQPLAELYRELYQSAEMRYLDNYQYCYLKDALIILELESPAYSYRTNADWHQRVRSLNNLLA